MTIMVRALGEHQTVRFAKEELETYMLKSGNRGPDEMILLGTTADFGRQPNKEEEETDRFSINRMNGELQIIGTNPRSVLYGVYQYCKEALGCNWSSIYEWVGEPQELSTGYFEGRMKRRGYCIENYDDLSFISRMVDWQAKHFTNELFFTFMLWDKLTDEIKENIAKRDYTVTLGGHCLHYLGGSQEGRIVFKDELWQERIIQAISPYTENESIHRISIWPEDAAVEEDDYWSSYIGICEKVGRAFPHLKVEHIAYNAGLAWNMLEMDGKTGPSRELDTLFAYWGRDYRQPLTYHGRHLKALVEWIDATDTTGKELTIFEYYSDHFMLGGLYPPLFQRISRDLNEYFRLGAQGIINLFVPFVQKPSAPSYLWKEIHCMNAFFFSRLSWGDRPELVLAELFAPLGDEAPFIRRILKEAENLLAGASKWNVLLFPDRITDSEKAAGIPEREEILEEIRIMSAGMQLLKRTCAEEQKGWQKYDDSEENPEQSLMKTIGSYIDYLLEQLIYLEKKWTSLD